MFFKQSRMSILSNTLELSTQSILKSPICLQKVRKLKLECFCWQGSTNIESQKSNYAWTCKQYSYTHRLLPATYEHLSLSFQTTSSVLDPCCLGTIHSVRCNNPENDWKRQIVNASEKQKFFKHYQYVLFLITLTTRKYVLHYKVKSTNGHPFPPPASHPSTKWLQPFWWATLSWRVLLKHRPNNSSFAFWPAANQVNTVSTGPFEYFVSTEYSFEWRGHVLSIHNG